MKKTTKLNYTQLTMLLFLQNPQKEFCSLKMTSEGHPIVYKGEHYHYQPLNFKDKISPLRKELRARGLPMEIISDRSNKWAKYRCCALTKEEREYLLRQVPFMADTFSGHNYYKNKEEETIVDKFINWWHS